MHVKAIFFANYDVVYGLLSTVIKCCYEC